MTTLAHMLVWICCSMAIKAKFVQIVPKKVSVVNNDYDSDIFFVTVHDLMWSQ